MCIYIYIYIYLPAPPEEPMLVSFIQKVEAGYFDNPFHNFAHGVPGPNTI